MKTRLIAACCLLTLSSGTPAAVFPDNEAREEIIKLRQYVKETQAQRLQDIERKQGQLESSLKEQILNLINQLDQLNARITTLTGQIEELTNKNDQLRQEQAALYKNLDARQPATKPEDENKAGKPVGGQEDQAQYQHAMNAFNNEQYKDAISGFSKLIESSPNSTYVADSFYWMGYAQLLNKDYKTAIETQSTLLKKYPQSPKAAEALYAIANAQIQLSKFKEAKKTLQTIVQQYPDSSSAPLAKKRLAKLNTLNKPE